MLLCCSPEARLWQHMRWLVIKALIKRCSRRLHMTPTNSRSQALYHLVKMRRTPTWGAYLLPCNPSLFVHQVQPVSQHVSAHVRVPFADQQLQHMHTRSCKHSTLLLSVLLYKFSGLFFTISNLLSSCWLTKSSKSLALMHILQEQHNAATKN